MKSVLFRADVKDKEHDQCDGDAAGVAEALHKMEQKGESFALQTYIFPKSFGVEKAKARLKDRGSSTTVDETEESLRFRQRDPSEFIRMRTVDKSNPSFKWLPAGVKAVVGPVKKAKEASMLNATNPMWSKRREYV